MICKHTHEGDKLLKGATPMGIRAPDRHGRGQRCIAERAHVSSKVGVKRKHSNSQLTINNKKHCQTGKQTGNNGRDNNISRIP